MYEQQAAVNRPAPLKKKKKGGEERSAPRSIEGKSAKRTQNCPKEKSACQTQHLASGIAYVSPRQRYTLSPHTTNLQTHTHTYTQTYTHKTRMRHGGEKLFFCAANVCQRRSGFHIIGSKQQRFTLGG